MKIKTRLSILTYLQFAIWGCYLVSLGQYLGSAGLGSYIQWFFVVGGLVALVMPALVGAIADRFIQGQRLMGICHFLAAGFMFLAWRYCNSDSHIEFGTLFSLFTLSVIFFQPTVALCNSVSFGLLRERGLDPVKEFPAIRIWGTIGFVASMWIVNSLWVADGTFGFTLSSDSPHSMQRFQYTDMQLLAASVVGFITSFYSFTLPALPIVPKASAVNRGWRSLPVIGAFRLLGDRKLLSFFIFSMLIGVALQINNGYVTPYLTHFRGIPEYAGSFGSANATLLSSLSQISEALWILPVGAVLARCGIKKTIICSIFAWVINFLSFALGNTGSGLWLIIIGMSVYGIAFDFFNVAGALYINKYAPESDKSAAQGLLMMMTKGIGASVGMIVAGYVVNSYCKWEVSDGIRYFSGDWTTVWLIFAGYCLLVATAFILLFKSPSRKATQ